jgi:hypothetical protein
MGCSEKMNALSVCVCVFVCAQMGCDDHKRALELLGYQNPIHAQVRRMKAINFKGTRMQVEEQVLTYTK